MNIYQLHYTRLGRQGSGAGWQVTAASKGTPQMVVNAFYKLAANLVAAATGTVMPPEVLDVQIQEHFVYISHVNYSSKNIGDETDIRGVSFVHAYVLRAEDYLELIKEPDRLTGLDESCFDRNYEGKKELPVLTQLPYVPMNMEEVRSACGLSEEGYRGLMSCVYAALNSVGGSVCIRSAGTELEQFKAWFREISYLVYQGLPYVLRLKLSLFSYYRTGVTLCFSRGTENEENYFDLDTGAFHCPERLSYDFIEQVSSFSLSPLRRKELFESINQFTDVTYGGNYEAIKLHHLEIAYQAVCREVSPEKLDACIKDAAGLKAFRYEQIDAYYAYLIGQYLSQERDLPGADIYKKIQKRYMETSDKDLKRTFCQYYAEKMCMVGNVKAYEALYQFQMEQPADYQYINEYLITRRPEFLEDYYLNYYVERHVDSLAALSELTAQYPEGISGKLAEKVMSAARRVFKRDMAAQKDNEARLALCQQYDRSLEKGFSPLKDSFGWFMRQEYWAHFDESQFDYSQGRLYESMGLNDRAHIQVPDSVRQLMQVRENFLAGPDAAEYERMFFTNELIRDEKRRNRLKMQLRREAKMQRPAMLDCLLLTNYSEEHGFDLPGLASDIRECGQEDWFNSPFALGGFADSAFLNPKGEYLEIFKSQLKEKLKAEKKEANGNQCWIPLYRYYFPPKKKKERPEGKVSVYIWDYIQKWMMFLALVPMLVMCCRYLQLFDSFYGIVAAGISGILALTGMALQLFLGEMQVRDFLEEEYIMVIILTVVFVLLFILLLVYAVFAQQLWELAVLVALELLLVTGRICLRVFTVYE